MFICMYACVYVYIYVSQGDFWLISFTAVPATTSSVVYGVYIYGGTEWGLEIRLCVLT